MAPRGAVAVAASLCVAAAVLYTLGGRATTGGGTVCSRYRAAADCVQNEWIGCVWDGAARACLSEAQLSSAPPVMRSHAAAGVGAAPAALTTTTKQPTPLEAECRGVPLVVVGLYILKGNSKHKPGFFTTRLYQTLKMLGQHGVSAAVFVGGEGDSGGKLSLEHAEKNFYKLAAGKKRNKYTSAAVKPHLWYSVSELEELPYKVGAAGTLCTLVKQLRS